MDFVGSVVGSIKDTVVRLYVSDLEGLKDSQVEEGLIVGMLEGDGV